MLGKQDNESFINGKKYRWAITDIHGWNLSIKELRKVKLDRLNGSNKGDGYLLHVALKKTDEFEVDTLYFNYCDMTLKFKGLKFKCDSLEFAELLITSICNGDQYKIFPKYVL